MDRIILNEKNYKIWSNLVMGELEEANLEHTITTTTSCDNNTDCDTSRTTKNTTEGSINVNTISAKDDSKAKRIIYKHLSEETWEKVEDIDTAYELWKYLEVYYCETNEEKLRKYKRNLEELEYKGEEIRLFIADFENLWNRFVKIATSIDPLSNKTKDSNKLYYLRNSFKVNYPNIYERLTYSVVKEENMSIIKQIIELSLKDKETSISKNYEQDKKPKLFSPYYNAQPVQPVQSTYKKRCLLCGSFDHFINQCSLKESFNNWKKSEQSKLKEKEEEKSYSFKENYNVETEDKTTDDNNSF